MLLPLYDGESYRWDSLFLLPMNSVAVEVKSRVDKLVCESVLEKISLTDSRDCILVDNWRVLHGRSHVPDTDLGRIVERVYLSSLKESDND